MGLYITQDQLDRIHISLISISSVVHSEILQQLKARSNYDILVILKPDTRHAYGI